MKLIDFQDNLKPGDIIYYNNTNKYYRFVKFRKCNAQESRRNYGCKICKGYYFVESLDNKEESIKCGGYDDESLYEKMVLEEFITEEEFSI